MAVVIRQARRTSHVVDFGLSMTEELYASTFRRSHWNLLVRNGLFVGGSQWIWADLPKRFTDFAYILGYDARGDKRSPLSRAIASGLVDRLAVRYWDGWNPWISVKPPYALWRRYLEEERRAGRFEKSRTGYFTTARRELRRMVKNDLKRRVRELSEYEEINEKIPLVEYDRLRPAALSGSRAVARATLGNYGLRIVIPQPHPTHPVVGRVLRQVTPSELTQIGRNAMQAINAGIAGASIHRIQRGRSAGQMRRRLTPDQQASMGRMGTHRSRRQPHTSRSPAAA